MESVLQNVFLVGIFLTVNLHCYINPGRDTRSSVNAFRLWTYNNLSLCYLEKVDFFSVLISSAFQQESQHYDHVSNN